MIPRLLILIAIALVTGSCAILESSSGPSNSRETRPERTPDPPRETEWEVIAAGTQSAVRVPVARAVSSASSWRDIWYAITANQADAAEAPVVDFERETAIVLILGERPTGGYSVGIADIVERANEVEVVVAVSRPEPGEMVTQALTTPYSIAVVRIAGKEFVFTGDSLEAGFQGD